MVLKPDTGDNDLTISNLFYMDDLKLYATNKKTTYRPTSYYANF